jgi:glycerate 2-kinase
MKFLIAPNAFKGTLTATEAADEIVLTLKKVYPDSPILLQPVADGGDGTCSLLIDSLNLQKVSLPTLDPIGKPVIGQFGLDTKNKKAYLDVSTASGIGLLDESQKDPGLASTYGTGQLINKAIELGAQEILLGLGGSATVDMGTGILSALGVQFLNDKGRIIPPFSNNYLRKISHIQLPPSLPKIKFTLLCDVRNQFFGQEGAVKVFGPQKGLRTDNLVEFEDDCQHVFNLFQGKNKKPWKDQEGFGAAGGIALGLDFFFPVKIEFGANYFFNLINLKEKLKDVDWVITGEGKYDSQSNQGKACFELLQLAKSMGKKIALITSGDEANNAGFDLLFQLPSINLNTIGFKEKALKNFKNLLNQSFQQGTFL